MSMRVLLIGGGGREHALAWKIVQSSAVDELVCTPGNAGIAREPKVSCVSVSAEDGDGLLELARARKPDLVVVGPEAPLVAGLVDRLSSLGIPTVGPRREAAMLEGSKVFAKQLMQRHGIPTAGFEVFDAADPALDFIRSHPGRWVVKADGLAAGKGVFPCETTEEAQAALQKVMVERAFGEAGSRVVVESFLDGEEASCIALTDGEEILMLASSQDHKRALDGDRGPNTGGMGAYSPAPVLDSQMEAVVTDKILRPLIQGMAEEGIRYRGIVYAGLMIDEEGPRVLEFNTRFGDPETQPQLIRLRSDLVPALQAAADGSLKGIKLEWDPRPSVCVVMASAGYPGSYPKGKPIHGLEQAARMDDVVVFHAGTREDNDEVVTAGGRVLGVTALGGTIPEAVEGVYRAVDVIDFEGAQFRRDIAHRALARLK
jgi:phosphoribosylamine--glycine ligase